MRQQPSRCNETKHRLMSAKSNLFNSVEIKNSGLFDRTYISENNFSSLNLTSLLFSCATKNFCLVIVRITNLYNFVMNSTVW